MSSPEDGFDEAYAETPPWDIGRPQSAVRSVFESRSFEGSVLDIGCGTGENALFLADRGFSVLGIDASPRAIEKARAKARTLDVTGEVCFQIQDALSLDDLDERFSVVLDCGLFHIFDDKNRRKYIASLDAVTAPDGHTIVLCFSDREPGDWGPRRISEQELRTAFTDGWTVETVESARFEINADQEGIDPSDDESVEAWLAVARRDNK
ncbi:methyltransferase domain-containing protein [Haladaptatus pallidirubidus]|uniref:Class I SAM-dependent methyltransferase n=1 Tax=Haladaptatus pallidirubidus TaxID=1008152 RepID=A0AAV3UJ99_9EURY|nr:class I SAM-dependent methyltransferase [Haladaptatus pallidirubidus]